MSVAGVKPRSHLVPCPHCTSCGNHGNSSDGEFAGQYSLVRSFSSDVSLQTPTNEKVELTKRYSGERPMKKLSTQHHSAPTHITSSPHIPITMETSSSVQNSKHLASGKASKSPWRHLAQFGRSRISPKPSAVVSDPGHMYREPGGSRYLEPERDQRTVLDPYHYAFRYDDCVVTARTQDYVTCPAHGKVLLRYMAPDTVCNDNIMCMHVYVILLCVCVCVCSCLWQKVRRSWYLVMIV